MKHVWILAVLAVGGVALWALHRKNAQQVSDGEEEAKTEMLKNIKRFSGCCQSLLMAVQEQNSSLTQRNLAAWKKRMSDFPALCAYFEALCVSGKTPLETATVWLETLERWGIQHSERGEVFSVSCEHEALYVFDDVYSTGAEARVVQPAWWLQVEDHLICIETGAAEIQ